MNVKIVPIFASKLFSFGYQNKEGEYLENEYDRLMELWTDTEYLWEYAKANEKEEIGEFVRNRLEDADNIQDLLEDLTTSEKSLDYYFQPLKNHETGFKILALKKGKASKQDGLRLYAVKIDDDCFVITGGAIKMSQTMQEHPDTNAELIKLQKAQAFLKENGVVDDHSFFEFLTELK